MIAAPRGRRRFDVVGETLTGSDPHRWLACLVVPVSSRLVGPRPGSDGSERPGAHAPYYLVVESVTDAWEQVLRDLGDDVLPVRELGVVRVAVDYRHEVFVAPADFEVDVVRVGRSSLEFAVRLTRAAGSPPRRRSWWRG